MSNNLLNNIISKIKGEEFKLDKKLPMGYLISFFFGNIMSTLNGFFHFPIKKRIIVSRGVVIKAKYKIRFGENVSIGYKSYIDAVSKEGIILEDNVSIGKYTTIECTGSLKKLGIGLKVGKNVGLGTHGFWGCAGGIQVGNDTIFGNFVSLHSENHNYTSTEIPIRLQGVNHKGIKIGNNCWIGSKVTILDGVEVEDGCIIAAGALLTSGIYKQNSIYAGVPARFIKTRV